VQLMDTDHGAIIASMKVWIQKILHLIPDLDNNGTTLPNDPLLDLAGSKPLAFNTNYQISVLGGAQDTGNPPIPLDTPTSLAFKTRPEFGWYVSADKVGKYAGIKTKDDKGNALTSVASWEHFDLNVNDGTTHKVPLNFRLQFRAKNASSDGIGVVLYDGPGATQGGFSYDYNNNGVITHLTYTTTYASYFKIFDVKMQSSYVNINYDWYELTNAMWNYLYVYPQYAYANSIPALYNGTMTYYRFDVFGNTLALSYSADGIAFTPITLQKWDSMNGAYVSVSSITDMVDRYSDHPYKLFIRVTQPVDLDEIVLTPLNSLGAPTGGPAVMNVDFNTVVPPVLATDPTPTWNIPDLRSAMSNTWSGLN